MAKNEFTAIAGKINALISDQVEPLREDIQKAGAPYTPNAMLELIGM